MAFRWVVGEGNCLTQVAATWMRMHPQDAVQKIELPLGADYQFDLGAMDNLDPTQGMMFVAFDERFGNFKRAELMQAVMARGFKLDTFIAPSAIVPSDTVIGPNAFIGEGVVLGMGCRVDFNAVVRDGAKLGTSVRLRSSCWLDTGVVVGDGAEIGAHSILRIGTVVAPRVKVGGHCELGWARLYDVDVPTKTIYDTRYAESIRVYAN